MVQEEKNISQSQLPAGAKACHPVNLVIGIVAGGTLLIVVGFYSKVKIVAHHIVIHILFKIEILLHIAHIARCESIEQINGYRFGRRRIARGKQHCHREYNQNFIYIF